MTENFEVIASGFQFVEAPRVDSDGTVYFSDLTGGGYYRCKPGMPVHNVLPARMWIGGAVLDHSGSILLGGKGGLVRADPATGESKPVLSEIDGIPIVAVNDIEADSAGGIFGGTIDFTALFERGEMPAGGQFFHLSTEGEVRILREGLIASNGIGFSPDGRRLYHSESTRGIWAYTLGEDGMPGTAEMFVRMEDSDGLVVDSEGGIWVACWQSAEIHRYRTDGVLDRRIALPFPHIASLAFGGPDLTELYVATGGNTEHPGQGCIVRIKLEVPGLRDFKSRRAT
jgi:sugar lactone lactonase YvrE